MILPFSQRLNNKPTHFVEKVTKGSFFIIDEQELIDFLKVTEPNFNGKYSFDWDIYKKVKPKLHTIREDKKDRWKAGNKIHPVINNRSKKQLQFAPVMPCKSVQQIHIEWKNGKCMVFIDSHALFLNECEVLAVNDGFENFEEFKQYFATDFCGKIIHWTDLKY